MIREAEPSEWYRSAGRFDQGKTVLVNQSPHNRLEHGQIGDIECRQSNPAFDAFWKMILGSSMIYSA